MNEMSFSAATNPAADPRAYRRCLSRFTTGVTVVTGRMDGQLHGVTANSFTSISLEPPLVLWAISNKSRSYEAFRKAESFAINILSSSQVDVSNRFASSKIEDKFTGVDWVQGMAGAPILPGAAAVLECRMVSSTPAGDHAVLMGEVTGYRDYIREPLIFAQGQYAVPCDHPSMTLASGFRQAGEGDHPLNSFVSGLMYRAYASMSFALERVRAQLGLTHMEARLMTAIESFPSSTIEELAPELLIGLNASQHVRDALAARGLIGMDGENRLHLTGSGRQLLSDLFVSCREVEAEMLEGIDDEKLAANREVLATLIRRSRLQPPLA